MTTSELLRLAAAAALASVVYATIWVGWVPWALLGRDHLAARRQDLVRDDVERELGGPVTRRVALLGSLRGIVRSTVRPFEREHMTAILAGDTPTWARGVSRGRALRARREERAQRRGRSPRALYEAAAVVVARTHADREGARTRALDAVHARHDRHLRALEAGIAALPDGGRRLEALRRLEQRDDTVRRSLTELVTDRELRALWIPYVGSTVDLLGRGVTLGFVLGVALTGAIVPDLVVMAGWGGVGSLVGLVGAAVVIVWLDLRAIANAFGGDSPEALRFVTATRVGPWVGAFAPVLTVALVAAGAGLR
ncbi:hypothetical protein ATL41_1610 [Flavimobilis soli]|uniref:Uncharacterized protein n=1 Tax=Flavimobilis soli TaxID=442709 RepID=A0A2A9EF70_9MICO|nr:hypothetical protein [Flavimobilis soli]PFG36870.1 hypothetical protein ATL41_1610 [Flavimobilis soli]